jgi:hypothetical protein
MAVWNLLKSTPGWQIVELPAFPKGGPCQDLISTAHQDGYRAATFLAHNGPLLRMQVDCNGRLTWRGGTSQHFRHELRRFNRLICEEMGGQPSLLRWTRPPPEIVRRFYALEASGWKGKCGSAIDCRAETRSFYDEIARVAANSGCFCLHSLEFNGRIAAGAFSVVTDRCLFPIKIAYDEALHRAGPGHLLFDAILAECAERGIPELYFGGDEDRYKTQWTAETLPHFNGYIFKPDLWTQFAYRMKANVAAPLGKLRQRIHAAPIIKLATGAQTRAGNRWPSDGSDAGRIQNVLPSEKYYL